MNFQMPILLSMTWDLSTWLPLKVLSGLGQMSQSTRRCKLASSRYISLVRVNFILLLNTQHFGCLKVLFSPILPHVPCSIFCEEMCFVLKRLVSGFWRSVDCFIYWYQPIFVCIYVWQVAANRVQVLNSVNSKLPFLVTTADDAKDSLKEEIRLRY